MLVEEVEEEEEGEVAAQGERERKWERSKWSFLKRKKRKGWWQRNRVMEDGEGEGEKKE